ncbi:ABC transporter permease [Amycolatopsis sp. GM8]|uniref:ABC transporter permease n=1 Tax=Amycolatopsis sp. GM8 TaxID=2896530 RepID=UPI001F012A6E|nr:ABC transporter permease subunit [Amycolatopsis sp. GM8]
MSAPTVTRPVVTASRASRSGTVTRTRPSLKALGAGIVLFAVAWEAIALVFAHTVAHPEYVMPDLWYALRTGLPGLSDYYSGRLGGHPPALGGSQSAWLGILALVDNSLTSLYRVVLGLAGGVVIGVTAGLAMSWSRPLRGAFGGVANLSRMMPLLAMGPLFTLWFGAGSAASIAFIVFSVAPIMLMATTTAVERLDPDQLAWARTLGAGHWRIWTQVVPRSIVPEVAGALSVASVLAWSVLLASELWGIQDGLGWAMGQALGFTQISEVMIIALTFIILTFCTVRLLGAAVRRLSRWAD